MRRVLIGLLLLPLLAVAADYTTFVQIRVKEQTAHGEFNDAIYYPAGRVPAEAVIQAEIAKRVAAWVQAVSNPPTPTPPTREDIMSQSEQAVEQLTEVFARRTTLTRADLQAIRAALQEKTDELDTEISR